MNEGKMSCKHKSCVCCVHLVFHAEEPGYSELTPGSSASFECFKGVWDFKNPWFTGDLVKEAEKCKHFEHREEK